MESLLPNTCFLADKGFNRPGVWWFGLQTGNLVALLCEWAITSLVRVIDSFVSCLVSWDWHSRVYPIKYARTIARVPDK